MARVKFEDSPEIKIRPVLIISKEVVFIISLKITSHPPREAFAGEYAIQDWEFAGLDKQSTIRVTKVLQLLPRDFVKKVGVLHPFDRIRVQNIWDELHKQR